MDKIEKVIKGLECHFLIEMEPCEKCPYYCKESCTDELAKAAIALLKAQEAVKPIENAGFYYCGACKYAFTSARQKYCSDCGRAVKWE